MITSNPATGDLKMMEANKNTTPAICAILSSLSLTMTSANAALCATLPPTFTVIDGGKFSSTKACILAHKLSISVVLSLCVNMTIFANW